MLTNCNQRQSASEKRECTSAKKPSILIVEDHPVLANVVCFTLRQAGFETSIARNGLDALRLLGEGAFELVVTDFQMPEMNGAELCKRMREQSRWAETPIVLLTAKGMELDLVRFREELGVAEVFFKPFSPRALTQTIQKLLAPAAATS
jgi:CheY-like chemotaxis protein